MPTNMPYRRNRMPVQFFIALGIVVATTLYLVVKYIPFR